uniref:Uncharacterized protein n=1 Tax=Globodera rostochiensis TaxID=31243 RepID=A0A914I0Z7_GLORO
MITTSPTQRNVCCPASRTERTRRRSSKQSSCDIDSREWFAERVKDRGTYKLRGNGCADSPSAFAGGRPNVTAACTKSRSESLTGLGRYLRHTTKCERAVEMGLSYIDVHMIFLDAQAPGSEYNIAYYNCKNWASEFYNSVIIKTRRSMASCICPEEFWEARAIDVHQNSGNHVVAVTIRCNRCARGQGGITMFRSFEFTKYGKRWMPGRYEVRENESLHANIRVSMATIMSAYRNMPGRYDIRRFNSFDWARQFYTTGG